MLRKVLGSLILAFVLTWSHPSAGQAEEVLTPHDVMPYLTLIDEFTLYSSEATSPKEAMGKLSGLQSVQVAPMPERQVMGITRMQKLPIETWLGIVWINLSEGRAKFGKLEWQEQTLTLLDEETYLYADPTRQESGPTLAPQSVRALASLPTCDPFTPCRSNDRWYLIETSWLGHQWILPYHFAEKYVVAPVEGMISVEQESPVFRYPFDKPIPDEPKVKPQVMKPVGKYLFVGRAGPSLWYQVQTEKGLRWIQAPWTHGLGFEKIEAVDEQLVMPVPFRFQRTPFSGNISEDPVQPPQTLHATGKRSDAYFVVVDGAGHWVNPSAEIAMHIGGDPDTDAKLGVEQQLVTVELDEDSVALDVPYADQHSTYDAMTFTPQSVTASRYWKAPTGVTWYYIHTWQGAKWALP